MAKTAIIFDLDGTLLDTLQDLAESCNLVRQQQNMTALPYKDYALMVGNGLDNLMRQTLSLGEKEDILSYVQQFKDIYQQQWQRNCCPYPGIDAMLGRLVAQELPLAILSNKPHEFTQLFVKRFLPKVPFTKVYGQRPKIARKPNPAGAMHILQELGCTAKHSVFVGDSGVDMQTGKAAGMRTAGVSWGFRSIEELQDNGADIIIDTPLQLVEYVSTLT